MPNAASVRAIAISAMRSLVILASRLNALRRKYDKITGCASVQAQKHKGRPTGDGLRNLENENALAGKQSLALRALALQLAVTADRLGAFARALLAGLFVMASELHLAKDAFTLHLLFQRFERLIDI